MALRNPRTASKAASKPPAEEITPRPVQLAEDRRQATQKAIGSSRSAGGVQADIPNELLEAYFAALENHFQDDPVNLAITNWVREGYAAADTSEE